MTDSYGGTFQAQSFQVKRGDGVEVRFIPFFGSGGPDTQPYSVSSLQCGLFRPGGYGVPVAGTSSFTTATGVNGENIYTLRPNLNTLNIAAMFVGMQEITTASGASYTLVATDVNNLVALTHTSNHTCTVPPFASVAWATNSVLVVRNNSTGVVQLTLQGGAGVTLTAVDTTLTMNPGEQRKLTFQGNNIWNVTAATESDSVVTKVEFQWVKDGAPVSTSTVDLTVENDYIREGQDPAIEAEPLTDYISEADADGRYLKIYDPQSLDAGEQTAIIEALGLDDYATLNTRVDTAEDDIEALETALPLRVAYDAAQTVSTEQKDTARANLALRTIAAQVTFEGTLLTNNAVYNDAQKLVWRQQTGAAPLVPAVQNELMHNAESRFGFSEITAGATVSTVRRLARVGVTTDVDVSSGGNTINFVGMAASFAPGDEIIFSEVTPGSGIFAGPLLADKVYYLGAYTDAPTNETARVYESPGAEEEIELTVSTNPTTTLYRRAKIVERYARRQYVSSSSSGNSCGWRAEHGHYIFNLNGATDLLLRWRFTIEDPSALVSGARMFVGLAPVGAFPANANPSGMIDCLGIYHNAGESAFTFRIAGRTDSDSVATSIAPVAGGVYDLTIERVGASEVRCKLNYLGAGLTTSTASWSGVLDSWGSEGAPADFKELAPVLWRSNAAQALAVACGSVHMHLLTSN